MTALSSAALQAWPPFVLVTGLLLIGQVAASDAMFESIGSRLAALPGNSRMLFFAMMSLVAVVTVVLNLDTSIVFLTPIVLHTARQRKVDERAFLYGAIFMSNAASLLLPGSNLTNLLVVSSTRINGAKFAVAMLPAWLVAVSITALVVALWCWRELGVDKSTLVEPVPFRVGLGVGGVIIATGLVLTVAQPAVPIFVVGAVLVVMQAFTSRRIHLRTVFRSTNVEILLVLYVVAVGAGAIARVWNGPHNLIKSLGFLSTAAVGGGAANLINNLPATMLFSSQLPPHPQALLIGLDLGPNLATFGAMSSLLWLRISRAEGASPSAVTFCRVGIVLAPVSIAAASFISQHLVIGKF
jgi:arsenical pump membrane protein